MRIPWGAPTIGDSTKMGLVKPWHSLAIGTELYELLLQPLLDESFSNMSAWARVGVQNLVRVVSASVTSTTVPTQTDACVRKDFGANYFSGNFTHDFDLKLVTAPSTAKVIAWAMESTAARTDADMLANNTGIAVQWNKAVTNHIITLYNYTDDTSATYDLGNATTNTQLYCRIDRTSTDGTLTFYTTAARSSEITHIHLTIPNTSYRYLFAMATPEAAASSPSWITSNLALTSGGTAINFNADNTWPILEASETPKLDFSGGVVTVDGDGSDARNGFVHVAGLAAASNSCFQWTAKWFTTANSNVLTINSSSILSTSTGAWGAGFVKDTTAGRAVTYGKTAVGSAHWHYTLTNNTNYTFRIYLVKKNDGVLSDVRITVEGGTEFPNETLITYMASNANSAAFNPGYPSFWTKTSNAALALTVSAVKYLTTLSSTTLTYVANAGAGNVFGGLKFSALTNGGWATTNATFKWSYDDGVASWSAAKTWANLLLESELTTRKRYIRLEITASTDGTTQQYAGQVNADDATSLLAPPAEKSLVWVS